MPSWSNKTSTASTAKSHMYWPLSRSSSSSRSDPTEEEMPLSGDHALNEDQLHGEKPGHERGWYTGKPRTRSRFRPLLYHLVIVGIYSLAFIGAAFNASKNRKTPEHLVYCMMSLAIKDFANTGSASA